jgi:cellobiose phosphorylase
MEKIFAIVKTTKANWSANPKDTAVISGYVTKEDAIKAIDNLYERLDYPDGSQKSQNPVSHNIYVITGGFMNQMEITFEIMEIVMNKYL